MTTHRPGTRAVPGDVVAPRTLTTVDSGALPFPDAERLVHLQLRRFAGCPVCNLHLRAFDLRHDEIRAAGVREVAVFHSPADELRRHVAGLRLAVVADPGKALYAELGAESSPRALFDPRAWPAIVRAVAHSLRRRRPLPPIRPQGGRWGLPADLLVAPDGTVVATRYGAHVDDQWTVDELLAVVADHRSGRSLAPA